jgi:hypothetical protein
MMKNNRTGVIEDPYVYEKQSHWCYRITSHIPKYHTPISEKQSYGRYRNIAENNTIIAKTK